MTDVIIVVNPGMSTLQFAHFPAPATAPREMGDPGEPFASIGHHDG